MKNISISEEGIACLIPKLPKNKGVRSENTPSLSEE